MAASGRAAFLVICTLCVTFAGCGGPPEKEAASGHKPPNSDKQRFTIVGTNEPVRIGADLNTVSAAFPMPSNGKPVPQSALPKGYSVWGWTARETKPERDEAIIGYFEDGKLISLSHSITPIDRDAANALVDRYRKPFGEPSKTDKTGVNIRRYGTPEDACLLELQTIRMGNRFTYVETLTDCVEAKRFGTALANRKEVGG